MTAKMREQENESRRGGLIFLALTVLTVVFFLFSAGGYAEEPYVKNVCFGVRVSFKPSREQLKFINSHFDYVMTPFLKRKVRASIEGPVLLLYRSIQGTWTDFKQFDWFFINSHENMFCHHSAERIKTVYNSWLMDSADLVDADSEDALCHWVNYYAVSASRQVYRFNYDGLFIDSAGHRLWRGAVNGVLPDDYSDERWKNARRKALRFIKKHFLDKLVIFNGLHSDKRAEGSLSFTDGGMWETFAFNPSNGRYYGFSKWKEAIELARRNSKTKFISIVSKKRGVTTDTQSRMFIFTSCLLVGNRNVVIYISDLNYNTKCILYYPEYEIDLGRPLGDYVVKNGIYQRRFNEGLVLVNPDEVNKHSFLLDGAHRKVIPFGGGPVQENGYWEGSIRYEDVRGKIALPALSGVILIKK